VSCKPSRGLLVGLATRLHVGVTWLQALENLTSCPQLSREPLFHIFYRLSSTLWSGRARPMRRAASSPSSIARSDSSSTPVSFSQGRSC
jgi:hypothetical protein